MRDKRKQLTDEALELIAVRFRVLSEPMRLKLLNTLGEEEMSVGNLVEATGAGQANVSKHLSILLKEGIVARRKDGLNIFYRVADKNIFDLCESVCASLGDHLIAQHSAVKKYARR
jgi:ArsR family transcriptional regulator